MGATAVMAAISVGAAAHTASEAKQARRAQERASNKAEGQRQESDRRRRMKERQADETQKQRDMRQRQKSQTGGMAGRQGTILGGAPQAGNTGNQSQAGAGKTLLGV